MHLFSRALSLAMGVSLLVAPTLAQQPASSGSASPAPMQPMPGMAAAGPADRAMTAGMEKMNRAMSSAPMTGNPDQDFVAMMMPHHQGAIDMARIELQYGKDPVLRRMARDIVSAQEKEIGEMLRWQARHPHTP